VPIQISPRPAGCAVTFVTRLAENQRPELVTILHALRNAAADYLADVDRRRELPLSRRVFAANARLTLW
jgi:hypothetical protein